MRPKELRTLNLRMLVHEFGTIAEVSRQPGVSEKYLSQILRGTVQRNSPRAIGDGVAEKLEKGCKKPQGWMDTDHSANHMPPADAEFIREVQQDLAAYEVPDHIKKTILTLITSSPKKES